MRYKDRRVFIKIVNINKMIKKSKNKMMMKIELYNLLHELYFHVI